MPDQDSMNPTGLSGYLLGFDYGHRRIGVAVGQTATGSASPLIVVKHNADIKPEHMAQLIKEWKPVGLVIGLPLDLDGNESDMSKAARSFGSILEAHFSLPVFYMDERLSSRAAESRFAELRAAGSARQKDAARLDAVAAQIILENWLQARSIEKQINQ